MINPNGAEEPRYDIDWADDHPFAMFHTHGGDLRFDDWPLAEAFAAAALSMAAQLHAAYDRNQIAGGAA